MDQTFFFETKAVHELASVTREVFEKEILPVGRPVVMRGLVFRWPAVLEGFRSNEALAGYIKQCDIGAPTTVLDAPNASRGHFGYGLDMEDFNFNKRIRRISAALDQLIALSLRSHPSYLYIQSTPLKDHLPQFAAENIVPILAPTVGGRIWIGNATRAQTHNDMAENVACVVAGRRTFTLFPPEQLKNLYIGPLDHSPSGRAISLASLENPDFERFPKLKEALGEAYRVDLHPGDALYIPAYWWHHVQALETFNVLVNYWLNDPQRIAHPLTAFQAALLAMRDLSPSERAYWRAAFDHYVFKADGDPVDHIPPKHRGILGVLTPALRGDLIRELQRVIMGLR